MELNAGKENYSFPKGGNVEFERLDTQHELWLATIDGIYPPEFKSKVERMMKESKAPAILDVGCGSAIWSIQMAIHFPQASVVGLDLTLLKPRDHPSNFSFKIHNLADGLPSEYGNKFDIIHCRTVVQHMTDPQGLVNSMAGALKPGGLLLFADVKLVGYGSNRERLTPAAYNPSLSLGENLKEQDGHSWHAGWVAALGSISLSPSYQPPNILVQKCKGLAQLNFFEYWVPSGSMRDDDDQRTRQVAKHATEDLRNLYGSTSAMFAQKLSQVPEQFREALRERGLKELMSTKYHNQFWYVVATKA